MNAVSGGLDVSLPKYNATSSSTSLASSVKWLRRLWSKRRDCLITVEALLSVVGILFGCDINYLLTFPVCLLCLLACINY